jgi:hypothetical protein
MRKLKNIKFYNRETGEQYSYWVVIPVHLLLIVCFAVLVWQSILLACEIRGYLKNKTYNKKCQTYPITVSPKPINMPYIHAGNGLSVFVVDAHLKAFAKYEGTTNNV